MTIQNLNLPVSANLYRRIQQHAAQSQRSMEEVAVEVLDIALPQEDALPQELEDELAAITTLDDERVWAIARSHFPDESAERLAELNDKQQREGLTKTEKETSLALVREYERCMLVRAQAALTLKQRGYDISVLLTHR